jgi:hypothetical protein
MKNINIAFDLDGVLAKFDERVLELSGQTAEHLDHHGMLWSTLEKHQRFFLDLAPYDEMVAFALEMKDVHSIRVITGRPRRDTMPFAEPDKIDWVAKTLGLDVPTIVCLSRHKHHHLRRLPDLIEILIDDRMDNIERWNKAGGVAIFHDGDIASTIATVRSVISQYQ